MKKRDPSMGSKDDDLGSDADEAVLEAHPAMARIVLTSDDCRRRCPVCVI
ncbi:MAG: hypothetical protein KY439_08375 [Actinobacteria bacterium]|nr:hypothetical protein [Actinomycetota bacterium]